MMKKTDDEVENFNNVTNKDVNTLNEGSIQRMLQWLQDCDCAFIGAFRSETLEVTCKKSKFIVAELLVLGYGVAKIKGVCSEGMTDETSEESYLVVNRAHYCIGLTVPSTR